MSAGTTVRKRCASHRGVSLGFPIPDSTILLGTDFFFQSVYLDPGAPQGLSATDGIKLNVR